MAEPINHNTESGVLTAAGSAAKWGLLGVIAAGVLTAGAVVLGIGLAGGLLGSIGATVGSHALGAASFGGWAGSMLSGIGAWITGAIAVAGAVTYGATGALLGGLFGLAKGGSRVNAEKEAYHEYAQTVSQTHQQKLTRQITDAEIAAEQRGYVVGAQDAEAHIANQLQTMAMQQQSALTQSEQTTGNTAGAVATATAEAHCECPVIGEATKKIAAERNAASGVTPQIG